ncbi:MAG: Sec-independent protein translocase protein TatB [Aquabacterium sp.]|nr:Sec-independent protein translocase protein TatB [Aquabacterium sp.]MDO9005899.1 Sec-independent protein translocase protein TatB [Aquabacterium sp.]
MIDFGIDKLALIGAVALIVIGPEKLPRVARTVGLLVGKAQRYVSQVQSEVNRSIELEELKKVKSGFEDAARNVEQSVSDGISHTEGEINAALGSGQSDSFYNDLHQTSYNSFVPKPVRKNWRLKRAAMPTWYKQQNGVRRHVQSGAARVARFRPPATSARHQP